MIFKIFKRQPFLGDPYGALHMVKCSTGKIPNNG